jgi:hypothetical protein
LALLIPTFNAAGARDSWCVDNTQHKHQSDGGNCLYQSIWFGYFVLNGVAWWLVLCFDTFMRLRQSEIGAKHVVMYFVFAFGYPLLVLTVILAEDLAGYEPRSYWCLFGEPKEGKEHTKELVELGLFYGSMVICWTIGFVLVNLVVNKWKAGGYEAALFAQYKQTVIFTFVFNLIWPIMWAFKYIAFGSTSKVRTGAADWVACLLTNYAGGIADPANSALSINYGLNQYGIANGTGCGMAYPYAPGTFVLSALAMLPISLMGFILCSIFLPYALAKPEENFESMDGKKKIEDIQQPIAAYQE